MAGFGSPIDDGLDIGSLEEANIASGDYLLIERTRNVHAGDIVVAEIDGDYVVRFLRKNGRGEQYLEAANETYPNLVPQESLHIEGKVIACIRKYGV